jgi:uncharacterized protein (TIGR02246 family)
MTDRPADPELVELTQRLLDAADRGDLDTAVSLYAPDAVWDSGSPDIPGERFEGRDAIRGLFEQWFGMLEATKSHFDEARDFGNGVVLVHLVQRAKPRGSTAWLDSKLAMVSTWVDGLIQENLVYIDVDEARVAAARLAAERGKGGVEST